MHAADRLETILIGVDRITNVTIAADYRILVSLQFVNFRLNRLSTGGDIETHILRHKQLYHLSFNMIIDQPFG